MSNATESKKEEYKRIVIKAITEEFKKPSSLEHDEVRAIAEGLEKGRELELKVLTGGLCNYSYKLRFKGTHDALLFVKLTFGTPILFPDVACTLKRTEYEWEIMKLFTEISPYTESCVMPYLCFDIHGSEENMKVLVTQYSSRLEEQAAHLFIDGGSIDEAFATKLATSMSALHNAEVTDPKFNEELKEFMVAMSNTGSMICASYFAEPDGEHDRTVKRAHEIGKEKLDEYLEIYCKEIFATECYIHGDYHLFNILSESNAKSLENGIQSTDIAIIDWEFATTGPIGRDIGWMLAFPMACALAHTVNGDKASTDQIISFIDSVWETYSSSINLDGKDLSLAGLYRRVLGYCGVIAAKNAKLGFHMDYLPIDKEASSDLARVKDSLGVVALDAIEIGFLNAMEGASLEELRQRFMNTVQNELDFLSPADESKSFKKSSTLRATGRRVSDAHSYFSIASEAEASEDLLADLPDLPYFNTRSKTKRVSQQCARTSLHITDLKRTSMSKWDTIVDFDF